jgi:hypothetical protein
MVKSICPRPTHRSEADPKRLLATLDRLVGFENVGYALSRRRLPRIVGGKIMMPADLKRLHEYMLEVEHIDHILDEMRSVVEREWPEMAHKLPPKAP